MKFITLLFLLTVAVCSAENDWSKIIGAHKRPLGRIVGGMVAEPHQFPYQVGLSINTFGGTFFCGGSLIAPNWVLSAAHCLQSAMSVKVYVGANDLSNPLEVGQKEYSVGAENIIVHEGWDMREALNDIALVHLRTPVEFNEYVKLVRLPSQSEVEFPIEHQWGLVTGWGRYSDAVEDTSVVLQYVMVPIVPLQVCAKYFPYTVRQLNVCTGGADRKSPCGGDSGGPLVANLPKGPAVVGIVSFGSNMGCEIGWPAVYTRVTSYLNWISYQTGIEIEE